jgi:hypothetical protein
MITATQTKERAYNAKPHEVRALLAGTKTQVRVVVKPQFESDPTGRWTTVMSSTDRAKVDNCEYSKIDPEGFCFTDRGRETVVFSGKCPYGLPGDRLWVREAWFPMRYDYKELGRISPILYSDGFISNRVDWREDYEGTCPPMGHAWKSPIHMPREHSRLLLEVVSVRVERLQEISEADSLAEGCTREMCSRCDESGVEQCGEYQGQACADCAGEGHFSLSHAYRILWESINGPDSWALNPWVWVVEFKRVEA